ncbi:MAG: DUF4147 domain-containing protein [Planctomycetia bacterium]|jgi:hydroxypyruvate reductase
MKRTLDQLRDDIQNIWQAGVDAVRGDRLIRDAVQLDGRFLWIDELEIPLDTVRRIHVVGAGKACAAMARELEAVLGLELMQEKELLGWINVPENCVEVLDRIWLHGARPAGCNEPTAAGQIGTERIIELVESLGPDDLCLCLISGGGSALLPAPADGISLEDKLSVTRVLSSSGANIEQLNTVRKQLSRLKGGGLARLCKAGRLVSLIISDVLGDPLDMIASGPTVQDSSTADEALAILEQFDARRQGVPDSVFEFLERKRFISAKPPRIQVANIVIGNNATAVDAAGMEAERRGYSHAMQSAVRSEGPAEEVGCHLADMARSMRDGTGPDCLITGGEPVVTLADPETRGMGGRNQQLALAALERLALTDEKEPASQIVFLAGGTDGEDGPTDAAGAWFDAETIQAAKTKGLDPADYLARNDAYHFFEPLDRLLITGPTHTNVCDLRVLVVGQHHRQGKP